MAKQMRKWSAGLLVALGWLAGLQVATVQADEFQSNDLVAVCGDSITEQKDYSVDIEAYLLMCRPQGMVRTAQFGWSGDSMGWLWSRGGPKSILALHPSVITTCYGMNDGGYRKTDPAIVAKYRDGMTRLVKALKEGGARLVVVGSPGAVDSQTYHKNPADAAVYNETLGALRDVARDIAKENDCLFANVHDVMMDVMAKAKAKYGPDYAVAGGDGVHPGANGHLVMAYAFLKAMGCDGAIGTITMDLGSGKATASEGHKVLSSTNSAVEIESSRYPYCLSGKAEDPNATTGIVEFFPFNQDLNRLMLVVNNAPAAKYKVTWGAQSKVFAAADLAKGVNLASEFVDNPFAAQFAQVRKAIRQKQEYETLLYKSFMTQTDVMQQALQETNPQSGAVQELTTAMLAHDGKLAQDVSKLVTPVRHTITIEAVQ